MRKTLCKCCKKVWEESRAIPLEESYCPNCGTKALPDKQE